jgi:hypothetical protein
MLKRLLILIGYKMSVYIALFIFFLACFLGYASNLDFETLIQKAVIAGCLFGSASFISIRMLVKYLPEDISMGDNKDSNE